jgi:hypothetical protein
VGKNNLTDPELERGRLKKKQGKKKPGVTQSKTRLQPVDFFFFY